MLNAEKAIKALVGKGHRVYAGHSNGFSMHDSDGVIFTRVPDIVDGKMRDLVKVDNFPDTSNAGSILYLFSSDFPDFSREAIEGWVWRANELLDDRSWIEVNVEGYPVSIERARDGQ